MGILIYKPIYLFLRHFNPVFTLPFFVTIILIQVFPLFLKGQTGEHLSASYDQFYKNFYLLNPAIVNADHTLDLSVGNRSFTGLFQGVSRFYAGANLLIRTANKYSFHGVGIMAMTGKEGDIFNRNRLYIRYAWRTALANKVYFSAGIAGGAISYLVKSSVASGGGGAISPDANLGIWMMIHSFDIGVSYQQILNTEIQPISQVFPIKSFFNININSHQPLTRSLLLNTYLYVSTFESNNMLAAFGPVLIFQNIAEGGFIYKYNRGFAVTAGICAVPLLNGQFRLGASYLISTRALSNYSDNILEITSGFNLINKKMK